MWGMSLTDGHAPSQAANSFSTDRTCSWPFKHQDAPDDDFHDDDNDNDNDDLLNWILEEKIQSWFVSKSKLECNSWNIFKADMYLYQCWIVFLVNLSKLICICIKIEFYFLKLIQSWFVFVSNLNFISWKFIKAEMYLYQNGIVFIEREQIFADLYLH